MNTNIGAPKMLMTVLICGSLRMYLSPSFASCLHLLSVTQEKLDGTQLTYTHLRTLSKQPPEKPANLSPRDNRCQFFFFEIPL